MGVIVIRSILTLGLIYAVYTETGIWTAISMFLIFLGMGIYGYVIKKLFRIYLKNN